MDRGDGRATGPFESMGSQRVRHGWATEHAHTGSEPKMSGVKSFSPLHHTIWLNWETKGHENVQKTIICNISDYKYTYKWLQIT